MTNLKLYPGMQRDINTQIHIENNVYKNSPPTRPFIIYSGTDITGTTTANSNIASYCSSPATTTSRYRLDCQNHNQLFQLRITIDNKTRMAYCLDKSRDYLDNDEHCNSVPFETLFQEATQQKQLMVSWILANTFPSISAADTFSLANVDGSTYPILDDNDAYAVVSVSLWVALGQVAKNEVNFIDCKNNQIHPKSNRLRTAVFKLLEFAMAYADTVLNQTLNVTTRQNSYRKHEFIQCYSPQTTPNNLATPYLNFDQYPNEIKIISERLLFGPFLLRSSSMGNPTFTIEPFCDSYDEFSASFADFSGNPINAPAIGQEFYISIRTTDNFLCFTLRASLNTTITRVIAMHSQNSTLYELPIGTCLDDHKVTISSELRICILNPHPQIIHSNLTPSIYPQTFPPTYRQRWCNPCYQYPSVTKPTYPSKPLNQARPPHPPKPPKPCPPEPCPPTPYTPKITTSKTCTPVMSSPVLSPPMKNIPVTVTDDLVTDDHVTNNPVTDNPATDNPVTDNPVTNPIVANTPIVNATETFEDEYETNNDYLTSIGNPPCPW